MFRKLFIQNGFLATDFIIFSINMHMEDLGIKHEKHVLKPSRGSS